MDRIDFFTTGAPALVDVERVGGCCGPSLPVTISPVPDGGPKYGRTRKTNRVCAIRCGCRYLVEFGGTASMMKNSLSPRGLYSTKYPASVDALSFHFKSISMGVPSFAVRRVGAANAFWSDGTLEQPARPIA